MDSQVSRTTLESVHLLVQMNSKSDFTILECLEIARRLVRQDTGKSLDAKQEIVLTKLFKDCRLTYDDIEFDSGYTSRTLKDSGCELWQIFSRQLDIKVGKTTFKSTLEQAWRDDRAHSPPTPEQPAQLQPSQNAVPQDVGMMTSLPGRDQDVADLDKLVSQRAKIILIKGEGGVGKSTLAKHYLASRFHKVLDVHIARESESISPVESIVERWLKEDLNQEPGRELEVSLRRLKQILQCQQVGIWIDNFESALDQDFRLISPHRGYVDLLAMLADPMLQSVTLITSREKLCEPAVTLRVHELKGLDETAWQDYFTHYDIQVDAVTLKAMRDIYAGNAIAMEFLRGSILEEHKGDINACWQDYRDDPLLNYGLRHLVADQFNRLQQHDPVAYQVLCRTACYRYQDLPVPLERILALLWDVSEPQPLRVIESLKNRSLIELQNREYRLRPMIREEGIVRLRNSGDWERAHQIAAESKINDVTKNSTFAVPQLSLASLHQTKQIISQSYFPTVNLLNNNLLGNNANSLIHGNNGKDIFGVLIGGNGDDTLYGEQGNDVLNGNAGDDLLIGNAGDNLLIGGIGNDTLNGEEDQGLLYGSEGNDALNGDAGNDTLYGGARIDTLDDVSGNDSLIGGAGIDVASFIDAPSGISISLPEGRAWKGDAHFEIFEQVENLEGSEFDAILVGDASGNYFVGFDGDDSLEGQGGNDLLMSGDGNGFLNGDEGGDYLENIENLVGSEFNDILVGDAVGSHFVSFGRDDSLEGLAGNALLMSSDGNDFLDGGEGDDYLYGLFGNDTVAGRADNRTLLSGQLGNTPLLGSDGNDLLHGKNSYDSLVGKGYDDLIGGADKNSLLYNPENHSFNTTDLNVVQYKLDLSSVFKSLVYPKSTSITNSFLQFTQSSSNASVQIDSNGLIGGANLDTLTKFTDVVSINLFRGNNVLGNNIS